jgi:septum formation inhibitor-activating ATPase MinD
LEVITVTESFEITGVQEGSVSAAAAVALAKDSKEVVVISKRVGGSDE